MHAHLQYQFSRIGDTHRENTGKSSMFPNILKILGSKFVCVYSEDVEAYVTITRKNQPLGPCGILIIIPLSSKGIGYRCLAGCWYLRS